MHHLLLLAALTPPARPPSNAFVLLGATAKASLVEMLNETMWWLNSSAARLAVALRRGRAGAVPGLELLLVCSRAAANAGRVVGYHRIYREGALDALYIEALGDLDALEHWVGGHHERVARHGPEAGQHEAG